MLVTYETRRFSFLQPLLFISDFCNYIYNDDSGLTNIKEKFEEFERWKRTGTDGI